MAAIVNPHPSGSGSDQLVVINVATGHVTTVATGYVFGLSFSPTKPYSLAYVATPTIGADPNVWSAAIGQRGRQLTRAGSNNQALWGPQGILYMHDESELELLSNGHSTRLMGLSGFPVALSSDGLHLVAENVACGAVLASSVNLATCKMVHQFPAGFTPFGITASGRSLLLDGSLPGRYCFEQRSVIESVPFAGGRPTVIAHGTNASWAGSLVANVLWP